MEKLILILKALLFGLVEGITEWLPISSTGHMIILESVFDVKNTLSQEFWDMFLVVIQLGAIIAVIVTFFNKINPFFGRSLTGEGQKSKEEKKNIWILWGKVLVACVPAAIVGLVADDWLDAHLYNSITVSITLIVYGVLFILLENWNKNRTFTVNTRDELTWTKALLIGCFQLLALIPGTSRSGVTILGAMLILCNREVASEFSFFLSIPVMFGASLLKGAKFMLGGNALSGNDWLFLIVGCVSAFVVSIFAIKFLMSYIKKHDFKAFGIYRIALGAILLILFLTNVIQA